MKSYKEDIHNHFSATLSDLDLKMVRSIPEGGNWKNIPESIPSKRLQQIRASYERGEGSRSTYYGRLRRDRPSYTINTYFNRPGNGCHIHYSQDRVLSQREAARLQSFPDTHKFYGPKGSVNKQIGNAVPPLLAYFVAKSLGEPGRFVDLFCGAGGLALGFKWAGWESIAASEIDFWFSKTYKNNIGGEVVEGSIEGAEEFEYLIWKSAKEKTNGRVFVLGGPPCQGFSTAGKRRSIADPRNQLIWKYIEFVKRLQPSGFVLENVTGLLNIEKGAFFQQVQKALNEVMPGVRHDVLSSERFFIPQRRKRMVMVGLSQSSAELSLDGWKLTDDRGGHEMTVEQAIADLPPLSPGEDGSGKGYFCDPLNHYQALMRGTLEPSEYLAECSKESAV